MNKLIGANFKVNLSTKSELVQYFDQLKQLGTVTNVDVFFCPQMPWISLVSEQAQACGYYGWSQNVATEIKGAFTGETSVDTLVDLWVTYCLVGHGERRTMYGDTDAVINTKTKLLITKWIRPVLCIGETLDQRKAGQTNEIITAQFTAACAWVEDLTQVDIAYEPLWAIGTGLVPTNDEIEEVHTHIRSLLGNTQSRILYGGSSNDQNAWEFITIPNVDGFLVGWASLVPEKFAKMIDACSNA